MKISAEIFRAYDIRGIVNQTLTADSVFLIGQAIGSEAQQRDQTAIIVARDGRLSGPTLVKSLADGILASGCDVIDIGAVPTPLLYFATNILASQSGVMLTGSHNPPDYNGIKIVLAGHTLANEEIQALYQRILQQNFRQGKGRYHTDDVVARYIARIKSDIKLKRKLKVVIDCGSGIPGKVAPELFSALGCEVVPLFCEVDGNFPHHHPDPSDPQNLQTLIDTVKNEKADIGLAFDGDGDRLGVVTDTGEIIWPDRQLMLFARDVLSRNPGAEIIFDVKCTSNLNHVILQHGGKPLMWKTGHSLIKAKLRETKAPFAGEMSGHIFFKERWFGFDDGLYTGARLLEILAADSRTTTELFHDFPDSINTPELKLPLPEAEKFKFMEAFVRYAKFPDAKVTTIDGVRADFKDGWGLIRPSNTTPYLILRFEANSQESLIRIQSIFRQQLLSLKADLQLPF